MILSRFKKVLFFSLLGAFFFNSVAKACGGLVIVGSLLCTATQSSPPISYPPIPFYTNNSKTPPYGWIYPGVGVFYPPGTSGNGMGGYPGYGMGMGGYPGYGMGMGGYPGYGMGMGGYPGYGMGMGGYPGYGMGMGGYPGYGMGNSGSCNTSSCGTGLGNGIFGSTIGCGLNGFWGNGIGSGNGGGAIAVLPVPIGMIGHSGGDSTCGSGGLGLGGGGMVSPSIQTGTPRVVCFQCGIVRNLMRPIARARTFESGRFY